MTKLVSIMKTGPRGSSIGPIHSVCYHRNGIGGQSFYAVEFTLRDSGKPRLLAIVPIEGDNPSSEAFVVTIGKLDEGWRGTDHFGPVLREVCKAARFPHEVKASKVTG